MVFKYHIKEIILSFLLIFMLFVNIVLVFDKIIFVPRTKPPLLPDSNNIKLYMQ